MVNLWMHRTEMFVDRSIPYILVLLFFTLGFHFFFREFYDQHYLLFEIFDFIIITFFVADLVFKYIRVRNARKFLRYYWLDIIAVFPFYLVLRLVEEVFFALRISTQVAEGQQLLHGGLEIERASIIKSLEVEKEVSKVVQEAEKLERASRTRFLFRFFRPATEMVPRLAKAVSYYERTTGKHHPQDRKK